MKDIYQLVESMDWKGLAKAWQEQDIKWYAKEWKDFITTIRNKSFDEALEVAELAPDFETFGRAGSALTKSHIIKKLNEKRTENNL